MNLVDSSGWIEYFIDDTNAKHYTPIIENTENLIVSVINIYEVYKKILQKTDENYALSAIALMQQAKVLNVTPQVSIEAARFNIKYKLPMADSIIYVTGMLNNAIIWTQDYDFINLPNVNFIKK
ncbi:MAG: VapC toxin family PIN domain ribonuclease [Ignavibacteriales bacterium CG18_big_fil_WC_8_21_14_2_50_31_20]|nr:MAG: VapC toxin family PIN domain ribonuclease [Ignavibacteriales bacterium CG18_big_fil_WC_8_21_14_2_50_31_20]